MDGFWAFATANPGYAFLGTVLVASITGYTLVHIVKAVRGDRCHCADCDDTPDEPENDGTLSGG